MKKFLLLTILALYTVSRSAAQSVDYEMAMDEIMSNHLSDYPDATINALNKLFEGVDIDRLPAETRFFYYYYFGGCYSDANLDDEAILYFTEARKIAYSDPNVGIRNAYAIDAEGQLAALYMSKDTEEYRAAALLLYNDVITVGISLIKNPDIGSFVVSALIEEAKAGITIWKDPEWVKKIWIKARDLAIELNDETTYSYYVIKVMKYYCDIGEYDTALDFMEDAKNKEILRLNLHSEACTWITETKCFIDKRESLKNSTGTGSLEYWDNELEIATRAIYLNSNKVSTRMLKDVEEGLKQNKLTESYQYAQVITSLANQTMEDPAIAERYFSELVNILNNTPQFFIYITDIETYNALGVCQMKQGKYQEAYANYKKVLELLERDSAYVDLPEYKDIQSSIYHNIGRNLYFLKDYQASVDYFTKSIALQESLTGEVSPKTKIYMAESLERINGK